MKTKITAEQLMAIGYEPGPALGVAIRVANQYEEEAGVEKILSLLTNVLANPTSSLNDVWLGEVASALLQPKNNIIHLKENHDGYAVFGEAHIEQGAITQMETAMRLPVSVAGALMPDAHQGYGLPIGGVLAVNNAVIPYGVGVDIGCRMALSIFDIDETYFLANQAQFKRELIAFTKFGAGAGFRGKEKADHEVLADDTFNATPFIKGLFEKAAAQLGTSGGGNHFVEWGILEMLEEDRVLNIPKGKYVALLSHSGSRGLGATIAGHYTKIAKTICELPQEAKNLAYLGLDSAEGQEYWLAMNLAGNYASACHEVIHNRLSKAMGAQVLARVENHHNFAWKEIYNRQEVIVHRKGATPASKDVLGIIPGSMTAPGFLVRGKGEPTSIHSASHGAGRQMSRTQAIKTLKKNDLQQILIDHGVTLIGAGLDEAPMAYKNIHHVMEAQKELVDVLASFTPKIVRMADDGSRED